MTLASQRPTESVVTLLGSSRKIVRHRRVAIRKRFALWRAVDPPGVDLDIVLHKRRNNCMRRSIANRSANALPHGIGSPS
jgi:hypothetical protein